MKLSPTLVAATEIAIDSVVIIALGVIVAGHRWLDITLWIVALAALIGAVWMASKRRRLRGISE